MSKSKITYSKELRSKAEAKNLPLWTVDVDRRHVKIGDDDHGVRMTMQGSGEDKGELVRRTLLRLCGLTDSQIDLILQEEHEAELRAISEAIDALRQS